MKAELFRINCLLIIYHFNETPLVRTDIKNKYFSKNLNKLEKSSNLCEGYNFDRNITVVLCSSGINEIENYQYSNNNLQDLSKEIFLKNNISNQDAAVFVTEYQF